MHEPPWGRFSRSEPGIGGPAPVVMPHLDEDLEGSAGISNFYSEFEAELDA